MSVRWNWDEKCGTAEFVQWEGGEHERRFTTTLYTGNAYLIFLNEWTEEDGKTYWSMYNFWVDEQHMKNTLGLNTKRGEENFNYFDTPECKLTKIRINKAKCRYWKKIIPALAAAFDDLVIELYTESEEES